MLPFILSHRTLKYQHPQRSIFVYSSLLALPISLLCFGGQLYSVSHFRDSFWMKELRLLWNMNIVRTKMDWHISPAPSATSPLLLRWVSLRISLCFSQLLPTHYWLSTQHPSIKQLKHVLSCVYCRWSFHTSIIGLSPENMSYINEEIISSHSQFLRSYILRFFLRTLHDMPQTLHQYGFVPYIF